MPAEPARRSDAEENRRRILVAARAALEDEDSASMAEISRRAGVGMATLYRNFPGRSELLEALYSDEVDAVCRQAATVQGATASARLDAWLRAFFGFVASKRQVAAGLLSASDGTNPIFGSSRARVTAAGLPLLTAAQDAGEVRADLSLDQVLDLVHAVATIRADASYVDPILRSALDGLRTR